MEQDPIKIRMKGKLIYIAKAPDIGIDLVLIHFIAGIGEDQYIIPQFLRMGMDTLYHLPIIHL